MSLLTAHKILISSGVALFLGYSLWEFRNYSAGDESALLRSALAGAATVGLAFYLRWVWVHRPSDPSAAPSGLPPICANASEITA